MKLQGNTDFTADEPLLTYEVEAGSVADLVEWLQLLSPGPVRLTRGAIGVTLTNEHERRLFEIGAIFAAELTCDCATKNHGN